MAPLEEKYGAQVNIDDTYSQRPASMRIERRLPGHELKTSSDPRQSSPERSLEEKAIAERDIQLRLTQTEEEARRADKALAQATIDADIAEKAARESQSRVQMLEERQRQTSTSRLQEVEAEIQSTPQPSPQPQFLIESRDKGIAQAHEVRQTPANLKQGTSVEYPQNILEDGRRELPDELHKVTPNNDIASSQSDLHEANSEHLRARRHKVAKTKAPKHQRVSAMIPNHGRPTDAESTLSKAFTSGMREQFVDTMAKRAAELVFAPKGQPITQAKPHALSSAGYPPGLSLLKSTVPKSKISASQQTVPIAATAETSVTEASSQIPIKSSPSLKPGPINAEIRVSSPVISSIPASMKPPIVEGNVITFEPEKYVTCVQQSTVGAIPTNLNGSFPGRSSLIVDRPQGRHLSIASSSSSHHSRVSSSPFLSGLVTLGICIVCLERDKPPINRLARCSKCSSLYHQSCHNPVLTRSVLEKAGENWVCRMCKQKEIAKAAVDASPPTSKNSVPMVSRSSGLGVVSKMPASDEKILEETVMVNKSSYSDLLQRHAAQWKSPTSQRESKLANVVEEQETVEIERANSEPMRTLSEDSTRTSRRESEDVDRPLAPGLQVAKKTVSLTGRARSISPLAELKPDTPKCVALQTTSINHVSPGQELAEADVMPNGVTFQEVRFGGTVSSINPQDKDIPASQSPSSVELSLDFKIVGSDSPPVIRPSNRLRRKRELVISDSEEEYFPIQAKKSIAPKAAMKSAPSTRLLITSPVPIKLPIMSSPSLTKKPPESARKSAVVAKKSGTKLRNAEAFIFRKSVDPPVRKGKQGGDLRSPILPVQSNDRRIPRPSLTPAERPSDLGESLQYSLRLILTTGMSSNTEPLDSSKPPEFEHSSLYPLSLSRARRPVPASPVKTRSRDKNNFDILSLVPDAAVPVIEDGKLAFREGAVDGRTGQLKRGARKFKVGRIIPGELF